MQHLMKGLVDQIGNGEDFGLVSDFKYLKRKTNHDDRDSLCERIFLHERLLGMWDPDDRNKALVVMAELPLAASSACRDGVVASAGTDSFGELQLLRYYFGITLGAVDEAVQEGSSGAQGAASRMSLAIGSPRRDSAVASVGTASLGPGTEPLVIDEGAHEASMGAHDAAPHTPDAAGVI